MSDPELNQSESDAVRRLLADARHTEPMPPEVAARLDAILADLHAENDTPEAPVPLANPPRRRIAGRLLLAAAAVVVAGVAIGPIVTQSGDDAMTADSSAGSAADEGGADADAESGDTSLDQEPAEESAPTSSDEVTAQTAFGPRLSPSNLRRDAERILADDPTASSDRSASPQLACLRHLDADRRVPVTWRGRPALLVERVGDVREVRVLGCVKGELERFAGYVVTAP